MQLSFFHGIIQTVVAKEFNSSSKRGGQKTTKLYKIYNVQRRLWETVLRLYIFNLSSAVRWWVLILRHFI